MSRPRTQNVHCKARHVHDCAPLHQPVSRSTISVFILDTYLVTLSIQRPTLRHQNLTHEPLAGTVAHMTSKKTFSNQWNKVRRNGLVLLSGSTYLVTLSPADSGGIF